MELYFPGELRNKMKEINLKDLEAVTHYTFSKIKINSNALLKIGEFLSLYKNKKVEVL